MPSAFIVLIVTGALAGWLARRIFGKVGPYGLIGDIIVGIVGAIITGFLLGLSGVLDINYILVAFLAAMVGALLLVWLLGKVVKR